jgi:hypothetical protein
MGFREISRAEYLARLLQTERWWDKPGRWQIEADLRTVADRQPN